MKCWSAAKSRSFYARDNVANFLKWCRTLGVREAVLFETEDLVSQRCAKNVVLCLLEVARIACSLLQFSPSPGLVQLEHEIDLLEQQEENLQNSTLTDYEQSDKPFDGEMKQLFDQLDVHPIDRDTTDAPNSSVYHLNQDIRKAEICLVNSELENQISNNLITLNDKGHLNSNDPSMHSSGDELSSCDLQSYVRSAELNNLQMSRSYSSISAGSTTESKYSENSQVVASQLDQKVMSIAKNFYGKKAKTGIQRISEGKYKVAGKIVFIRLLKNKHVMVRVGGGWTTLNHFLERHGSDLSAAQHQISAADLLPMDTRPAQCTSRKKLQNTLFAVNTQQLCNYAPSQTSAHESGQEHLFKQASNLGSKSNNEICNRANQLNYNQLNYNLTSTSGLRRCLSSTPVLSSPEPTVSSSGYCSSTTSNSNTAISNQSIINSSNGVEKHKTNEKRSDHRAKYTIDGYQSSNTSLNSCDRVLIKSVSSNEVTKHDLNKQKTDKDANKELIDERDKQLIKHSTPGLLRKPKSSIEKLDKNLIEKSYIPTISSHTTTHPIKSQPTGSTQQTKIVKNRTPLVDSKICRNAFGFIQTPILHNKIQAVDQTKQINKINCAPGQQLNTLSQRHLTTSLSSLPIKKTTMLPVLHNKQLRKNPTNMTNASKMSQQARSNSTQNVNVQSSNFGFHSSNKARQMTGLNQSKQLYNSSTSLNSMPVCRTKFSKVNSIKTRSTNNLDHISQDAAKNRYPNYLASSQHITNQNSDLENSTSSRLSSEFSPACRLRRPSLRAF